jgi:hypothetical protein
MIGAPDTISLSLVSHTNVGKTTLARTLLGRDIGEVRDEAHVTEVAEPHEWVATPEGDRLLLWDTPGFGDSLRLARRLAQAGNPIGWFLSEVWDRWRDRAFWSSQRALRHVLGEADAVLYLVNAAEAPEDAGYLAAELQVLALAAKPVIALLNQLGAPSAEAGADDPLAQRWQRRLATEPVVRAVLPLDAFSRCWVQEGVLWHAVAGVLPAALQPTLAQLRAVWHQGQLATWQAAMAELAQRLARAALDREAVPDAGWRAPLRALGSALGLQREGQASPTERAMADLAERLDADVRRSTDALIHLHALDGQAGREVLARLARHYAVRQPLDEGRAAIWGGLVTGALAGLKADIVSGGLTMGGGLLAGGVIGALGAAGAARGVNRIRGLDQPQVAWDPTVLDALLAAALLGYLAVAHHGRGRGAWVDEAPPAAWTAAVDAVLAGQRSEVDALWQQRQAAITGRDPAADNRLLPTLQALLSQASVAVLARLYPEARGWLPVGG